MLKYFSYSLAADLAVPPQNRETHPEGGSHRGWDLLLPGDRRTGEGGVNGQQNIGPVRTYLPHPQGLLQETKQKGWMVARWGEGQRSAGWSGTRWWLEVLQQSGAQLELLQETERTDQTWPAAAQSCGACFAWPGQPCNATRTTGLYGQQQLQLWKWHQNLVTLVYGLSGLFLCTSYLIWDCIYVVW